MDAPAYLRRIRLDDRLRPTLADLHEAHLLRVPFENLDIARGVPIVLDEDAILQKIVDRRRGGYCFELNAAFAWLLRALGYPVAMLAAGVARGDGSYGIPFDHMALRVDLERAWLADVGFGDAFLYPVPLDGEAVRQAGETFRVRREREWRVVEREGEAMYRFTLEPRELAEFEPGNRYHQTSPDSTFTRKRTCSLALPGGRVTLSGDRLVERRRGERTETPVPDEATWSRLLAERFGIRI